MKLSDLVSIIITVLFFVFVIGFVTDVFPKPFTLTDFINKIRDQPRPPDDPEPDPEPKPKPDEPKEPDKPNGCGKFKPTNPPNVPVSKGSTLNLSGMKEMVADGVSVEEGAPNRFSISGNVLTISMQPDDKDGNKGKSDGERQRNEISVKKPVLCLQPGESGVFFCQLRVNELVDWKKTFYHVLQIKMRELNTSPVFTISIRDGAVNARSWDADYKPVTSVCSAVGQWLPITVTVTNKEGAKIEYNVAGTKGTFKMPKTTTELYFKAGQYRDITNKDNKIPAVTSSSYKDIGLLKT